jgi:hypothetical protein
LRLGAATGFARPASRRRRTKPSRSSQGGIGRAVLAQPDGLASTVVRLQPVAAQRTHGRIALADLQHDVVRHAASHHLDQLRALWKPISPRWYLERLRDRQTLLVYARYDLTFPPDLSEDLVAAFRELHIPHEVATLRCGHYTIGKAPYKFVDGWILTRFLKRALAV